MKNIFRNLFLLLTLCSMLFVTSCGGGDDEDGPVVNSDILNVESGNITIGGDELTGTIVITANCHWTIQKQTGSDGDWLVVNPSEGTGNATVMVTANSANPSSVDNRKMTLVIKTDGGISRNIIVTQTTSTELLAISGVTDNNLTIPSASEGMTYKITVTSNTHWTILGIPTWLIVSPTEGSYDGEVTISATPNETKDVLRATLVFKGDGGKAVEVQISQEAAEPPVVTDVSISEVGKDGATITFSYSSMAPVTEYGVCYSMTNTDPSKDNSPAKSQTGSAKQGTATIQLTELKAGTTYYIRAYAVSAAGTQYSNAISFTTEDDWPGNDDNVPPGL
ncbi:MAG: fibronectin type III domain-containing protein [Bacteroidaceae bacterium]|nr:fibronectin type III domain-containing protein [Bacteroidaceae bacterium]